MFTAETNGNFHSEMDQGGGDHSDHTELEAGTLSDTVSHSKGLLPEKVKVLCWIMTGPKTHQTKVGEGLKWDHFILGVFTGSTCEGDLGVSV